MLITRAERELDVKRESKLRELLTVDEDVKIDSIHLYVEEPDIDHVEVDFKVGSNVFGPLSETTIEIELRVIPNGHYDLTDITITATPHGETEPRIIKDRVRWYTFSIDEEDPDVIAFNKKLDTEFTNVGAIARRCFWSLQANSSKVGIGRAKDRYVIFHRSTGPNASSRV